MEVHSAVLGQNWCEKKNIQAKNIQLLKFPPSSKEPVTKGCSLAPIM